MSISEYISAYRSVNTAEDNSNSWIKYLLIIVITVLILIILARRR